MSQVGPVRVSRRQRATRLLGTAVFLELNGFDASEIDDDDVYDLVIWVASGSPTLVEITSRFVQLLTGERS